MAGADLIQQKGRHFLILSLSTERLTLSVGADPEPAEFPNVIAYRRSRPEIPTQAVELTETDEQARREARKQALTALGVPDSHQPGRTVRGYLVDPEAAPELPDQCLIGEAVFSLSTTEKHNIIYPCCVGGLDPTRSSSQLRNDLSQIWTAAIAQSLDVNTSQFQEYGVVLLVPDDFSLGDLEVIVDALFLDMQFKEVVIHSNSTAAAFGQGMSSGCIVHVDDASITVSCIEDGILMSDSLHVLPFGGYQICEALHWMLEDELPPDFCPSLRPCDSAQLVALRDKVCFLPHEGTELALESQIRNAALVTEAFDLRNGQREVREMEIGTAACVSPMGLFFPSLLLPHSTCITESPRPVSETFYTEILQDPDNARASMTKAAVNYCSLSLDHAIVQSISATQNVENRRRFYTTILVVGPCSHLRGLPDMLERCVLSALPSDEVIDTVAVIEPKCPSQQMVWKGGVVLGCLSDQWVRRDEWMHEGKPNRFGKRDIARSRVYWMFKTETGMM